MLHAMNPFEVLAIDLSTTGEAGVQCFQRMATKAGPSDRQLAGVFLVDGAEEKWLSRLKHVKYVAVKKPMTLRDVYQSVLSHTSLANGTTA
jgi:hypothetical protein